MNTQRAALLRLLDDDDPATFALLKQQLTAAGLARLAELRSLLPGANGVAERHLREVIAAIEVDEADAIFAQLCAEFGEHGDLEEAAWRLAATFAPGEDFAQQRGFLDAWGLEVRRRLAKASCAEERVETLVEYLADEIGLRGNEDDYHNVNNSLLPEVIDTRVGLPITLSLIYILVGRRAGLEFTGVGLPGHFIVRAGAHFFDPFHRGRRVGVEECRAIAEGHGTSLRPEHLRPVTPRQMLTRMLANIASLARESDPPLTAKVESWIEALQKSG
jgi:regulator of sirC expression with transglutaminase-like and TPR domain